MEQDRKLVTKEQVVCDLRRYAARSHDTFYFLGWVPQDALPATEKLAAWPDCSCVVDDAGEIESVKPPTKLKNSFLGREFCSFLETYGLPAYNELDPSAFYGHHLLPVLRHHVRRPGPGLWGWP